MRRALPAFPHIHQRLKPVVLSCDPLHVGWPVGPASAQRGHMINVPARAGAARAARGRAGVFGTEGANLGAVARDLGLGRERRHSQTDDHKPKDRGYGRAFLIMLRCLSQYASPRWHPTDTTPHP